MTSSIDNAESFEARPLPERPSRRHSVRLKTPIDVHHGGGGLLALDWSTTGLRLQSTPDHPLADHFSVELGVKLAGCNMRLPVSCVIVWRDEAADEIGCQFVDVDAATTNALRAVFGAALDGRVAVADELLRLSPDAAASALFASRPLPARESQNSGSLAGLLRSGRYVTLGAFGVAVLAFAVTAVYDRLFVLEAPLAAISAPADQVLAPADGVPATPLLQPGQRVRRGDTLAILANDHLTGDRAIAAADVNREAANLAWLDEERQKREEFFIEYGRLAQADLEGAKAELKRALEANDVANRNMSRAEELQRTGVVSAQNHDSVRDAKARAERDVTTARAGLASAESNYRLAQGGHFYTGSRIEGGDPKEMANRVRIAAATLETARARLNALDRRIEGLTIRSQCDCIVRSSLGNRTWIQQGEVLYVLTSGRSDETQVQALISQDDATKIDVGSPAFVRYAHSDGELRGSVVAIDRQRSDIRRVGLPAQSLNDMRFASVLIRTDKMPGSDEVGTPTQVRFSVRGDASSFAFVSYGKQVIASLMDGVQRLTGGATLSAVARPLDKDAVTSR